MALCLVFPSQHNPRLLRWTGQNMMSKAETCETQLQYCQQHQFNYVFSKIALLDNCSQQPLRTQSGMVRTFSYKSLPFSLKQNQLFSAGLPFYGLEHDDTFLTTAPWCQQRCVQTQPRNSADPDNKRSRRAPTAAASPAPRTRT